MMRGLAVAVVLASLAPAGLTGQAPTVAVQIWPDTIAIGGFDHLQPRLFWIRVSSPAADMHSILMELPSELDLDAVVPDSMWNVRWTFATDTHRARVRWIATDAGHDRVECRFWGDSGEGIGGRAAHSGLSGCIVDGAHPLYSTQDASLDLPPWPAIDPSRRAATHRLIGLIAGAPETGRFVLPLTIRFADGSVADLQGPDAAPQVRLVVESPRDWRVFLTVAGGVLVVAVIVFVVRSWPATR